MEIVEKRSEKEGVRNIVSIKTSGELRLLDRGLEL